MIAAVAIARPVVEADIAEALEVGHIHTAEAVPSAQQAA